MAKLASSTFALDFLRRLLCAHTTASAAQCDGSAAFERLAQEPEPEGRSPCIVARLMGLDTMPPPEQRPLRRSMSAGSVEGRSSPPCSGGAPAPQPRAFRASASFREKPTYLREENDEFLLLSFSPEDDHGGDKEVLCLPASRSDDDDAAENGMPGKRRGRGVNPTRGRRKLQYCANEDSESASRRSSRAAAAECGLQNSSPVSVLEARDGQESSTISTTSSSSLEEAEQAEPGSPSSEEIQPQLSQQCCSRRKLQPDFDGLGSPCPAPAASTCHGSRCRSSDRERSRRIVNKAEVIAPEVSGIWQLICRLVEEDLSESRWMARDDANIAAKMEPLILDQLICEATDELMRLLFG